jgi:hypothetical protein
LPGALHWALLAALLCASVPALAVDSPAILSDAEEATPSALDSANELAADVAASASLQSEAYTLERSSSIQRGLSQAGITEALDLWRGRIRIEGFAMQMEPTRELETSGFEGEDSDRRFQGARFSGRGLAYEELALDFFGGLLVGNASAEADTEGAEGSSENQQSENQQSAWELGAGLALWNGRVSVGGEYTESLGLLGDDAGSRPDRGWQARATFAPLQEIDIGGVPLETSLSISRGAVAPESQALAESWALQSMGFTRVNWSTQLHGLDATVSFERGEDYYDPQREEVVEWRSDLLSVGLEYQPPSLREGERTGWWRWLGSPVIGGSWSYEAQKSLGSDPGLAAGQTYRAQDWLFFAGFRHERVSWEVRQDIWLGDYADDTKYEYFETALSGQFFPTERIRLDGSLTYIYANHEEHLHGSSWDVQGSGRFGLIPGRLTLAASAGWTRDATRYAGGGLAATPASRSSSGTLTWQALEADERRPRLTFSLDASKTTHEYADTPALDQWRAVLGVTVDWEASRQ